MVDHFDRLFRYADPKIEVPGVARNLVQAARACYCVILIARADSVSQVSRLPEFRDLFQAGQVPLSLSAGELRELIEEPARRVQLRLDAEVVDRLILDVQADPAALTLLQFSLLRLWDRRQGNRITGAVYDEVGGGRDAVGRVCDQVLRALAEAGRKAVARSVLLALRDPALVGQDYVAEEVEPTALDRAGHSRAEVDAVLAALETAPVVCRAPGAAGWLERFTVILESLPAPVAAAQGVAGRGPGGPPAAGPAAGGGRGVAVQREGARGPWSGWCWQMPVRTPQGGRPGRSRRTSLAASERAEWVRGW